MKRHRMAIIIISSRRMKSIKQQHNLPAQSACIREQKGARLAIVNNQKTYDAIFTLHKQKFWLGGSDQDTHTCAKFDDALYWQLNHMI